MIEPRRQLSCLGLTNNGITATSGRISTINDIGAGACTTLVDEPAPTRGGAAT